MRKRDDEARATIATLVCGPVESLYNTWLNGYLMNIQCLDIRRQDFLREKEKMKEIDANECIYISKVSQQFTNILTMKKKNNFLY